jgi:predicted anti-sigma-YlaC factor YlaD
MNCSFEKDIIQKYVDNTIDPLELIVLKEHIAVCEDCKFDLELMSKLENSMYEYFDTLPNNEMLNQFSLEILEECYSKAYSYKDEIIKAWQINKAVVQNASRYTSYLPGSKLAAKAAKKASTGINKAIKSYVRNSFKKLITGTVK